MRDPDQRCPRSPAQDMARRARCQVQGGLMYRRSYNRAVLRVRITTVTPLRIGAGDVGLDPSATDLTCVRTRHAAHGTTVYIPGSSFKGVVRATAEAAIRGQRLTGGRI